MTLCLLDRDAERRRTQASGSPLRQPVPPGPLRSSRTSSRAPTGRA